MEFEKGFFTVMNIFANTITSYNIGYWIGIAIISMMTSSILLLLIFRVIPYIVNLMIGGKRK